MKMDFERLAVACRTVAGFEDVVSDDLESLPDKGLAHDHVRIKGRGVLMRIPRQSQYGFQALENLTYQAACFERTSEGGYAPKLHGVIEPRAGMPMGALLVTEILGKPVSLPKDLDAIARCQASIHTMTVPPRDDRPPLVDYDNPAAWSFRDINKRAEFVAQAVTDVSAREMIEEELAWGRKFVADIEDAEQPKRLIFADTHPGNFLVDEDGRAFCVDLEKAVYGSPAVDLAHTTLYTSTTWDRDSAAIVAAEDVETFYNGYLRLISEPFRDALMPWLMPYRRITWLWSVTWCSMWLTEHAKDRKVDLHAAPSTEDWSAEGVDDGLIAHVRDRCLDYLSPEGIERVRLEWQGPNPLRLGD